jgi:hypothetical protein
MTAEVLNGVLALSVLEIPQLAQDLCSTLARTRTAILTGRSSAASFAPGAR